jgi:phosphatidylinositol alpha-1,6-mannosyltransferase
MPRNNFVIVAGEHSCAAKVDSAYEQEVHRLGMEFPDYGTFSPAGFSRYRQVARQVVQRIQHEDIVAVHCGALLPDAWIGRQIAGKRGIPLLVYLHGEELVYTDTSRQLDWMARRILNDAEAVVVNSSNSRQIALDHWKLPSRKVHVVHPGVDTTQFVPAARDLVVRSKLGWDDRPVLLTVGRVQRRKGHDSLIRALPMIRERFPNILYAIVGDGEELSSLHALIDELGVRQQVKFHRELADQRLVECFQQCDLFILPNRRIGGDIEGFGMVLLEAQACGRPVLAGDSGGTAETINAPHTGWTLDCTDVTTLSTAVSDLIGDENRRKEMGTAAREWVRAQFAWNAAIRPAASIFDQLQLVEHAREAS